LPLMRVLSDAMEMDTTASGTTADISFRLPPHRLSTPRSG
jgi:hypothetical protein